MSALYASVLSPCNMFTSLHKKIKRKKTSLFSAACKAPKNRSSMRPLSTFNDYVSCYTMNCQVDEAEKLPCSPWNFQSLSLFFFLSVSTSVLVPKAVASQIVSAENHLYFASLLFWEFFCCGFVSFWCVHFFCLLLSTKGASHSSGPYDLWDRMKS